MPELPDIEVYLGALKPRVVGAVVGRVRVVSPFVLRTYDPGIEVVEGRRVVGVWRVGKRIVLEVEGGVCVVIHLMIAGRLRWVEAGGKKVAGKVVLMSVEVGRGVLTLVEASPKKRAGVWVVESAEAARGLGAGGRDVREMTADEFAERLRRENRTLKRALADPAWFDGIGNAYSDEILHAAGLSPLQLTGNLGAEEAGRLHAAAGEVLTRWTERLAAEFGGRFPGAGEITAFRPGFAVHGKFGRPCPVCGTAVQRIRYAENETNYCPRCQTGGKVLADRSMSRLLKGDWPGRVEEWE